MRSILLTLFALLTLLAAACATTPTLLPPAAAASPAPSDLAPLPTNGPSAAGGNLDRVDQQGAVAIEITPVNLQASASDLVFDVAMNTHSVDLSVDLVSLASLSTDTGITVQATDWVGPHGGHHVSGELVLPARVDGKSILAGARRLTLTIVNLDAPSRTFAWDLK